MFRSCDFFQITWIACFNANCCTNGNNKLWKLTISRLKKQIEQDEQDLKQIISELQKSQFSVSLTISYIWLTTDFRICAEEF